MRSGTHCSLEILKGTLCAPLHQLICRGEPFQRKLNGVSSAPLGACLWKAQKQCALGDR